MRIPVITYRPKRISLSMTSMIDVVFLLLIFFICTSNFNPLEEQLPIYLSHPGSISDIIKPAQEEEDFKFATLRIIAGDRQIQWQMNDRVCDSLEDVEAVLHQLAEITPNLPILIEMDDAVAWEHFIHTYDLCRANGLNRVLIVGDESR